MLTIEINLIQPSSGLSQLFRKDQPKIHYLSLYFEFLTCLIIHYSFFFTNSKKYCDRSRLDYPLAFSTCWCQEGGWRKSSWAELHQPAVHVKHQGLLGEPLLAGVAVTQLQREEEHGWVLVQHPVLVEVCWLWWSSRFSRNRHVFWKRKQTCSDFLKFLLNQSSHRSDRPLFGFVRASQEWSSES